MTNDKIQFGEEGKKLYHYLMDYDLLQKKIVNKISIKQLSQGEFEILLYSFRFLLNMQIVKKKCFYNDLLKENIFQFIEDNYIPGTFPFINEFIKSYHGLEEVFKKPENLGYYLCKDCGYLYTVEPCTCPTAKGKCPNGHDIGGESEQCTKKDYKIFPNEDSLEKGKKNDSFISMTLEQLKTNHIATLQVIHNKNRLSGVS